MMKMDKEKRKKIYKEIEKKLPGIISTPTEVKEYHTLIASGFIQHLWEIWKKDCRERYNDVHWIKCWTDHLKAQAYDTLINSSVERIEQPAEVEKKEEKEEEIITFGDGGKGEENGKI